MSMQFVYGRAGTGKSQFCLEKIKEYTNKQNLEQKVFLIVPDQFSYSTEKKLLEISKTDSVINAEVISFKRIADRVFKEVGGATKVNLSKAGKAMILNSILENSKTSYLGKSNENVELCLRTITELKKHNITDKVLKKQIEKTENILLKTKLKDIYNIYVAYQNKIIDNFIDEDDVLTLLYKKIEESKMFDNSYVFIDEFSGFTAQEYEIIKKIMNKAKNVTISICTDSLKKSSNPDIDIFYSNKQTVQKLNKIAEKENIKIKEPINLQEGHRFKNTELSILEKNIYSIKYLKYQEDVKNIHLNLYANPYEEIENIAKRIINKVRDENYRYSQIAVITKNIEEYSAITKAIFEKYNIPVFIDEKSDLSKKIIVKYILAILDIFAKNWSNEAVWTYIKTGFLKIDREDIYLLENYCKKWGIRRSKWYKKDWEYDSKLVDINKINTLRQQVVNPLIELQAQISKNKTAKEITKLLYEFLEKNEIGKKLNEKIKELEQTGQTQFAKEYKSSWNLILEVFDEIVLVFKDEKITFENYRKVLKVGLEFSSLGKIPQSIDQVIVGDVERSRCNKVKTIFILGINDGIFPTINKDEGFLNDDDRNELKENGIDIANGTIENLYEDQFNIYKAFSTAEQDLYLSYTTSNKDGNSKRPSILISKIKKIFPNIKENENIKKLDITNDNATFAELLVNIRNFNNGEKIDEIWQQVYNWFILKEEWKEKIEKAILGFEYKNDVQNLTKKNIKALYGETLKTSVSRLEQYKKCPFSFYLKYGLKLKQEEEYIIKPIDTGTFMHDVIDTFFKQAKNIKQLTEEEVKYIVNNIIEEKLGLSKNYIFLTSPKFIVLTNRLKKVILQSIQYIVEQMKQSEFEIEGHEIEFTRNIDNVQITGKIDRIDSSNTKDGKYIRIIDYKSSQKEINLNELISGTQIQLITYIDSITDNISTFPAGMLYFGLLDPIVKSNKNLSDEEIKQEIRKNFKMNGIILADINIIKKMDKKLSKGYSTEIPVYIGKDGEISKFKSNVVTKQEFTNLQKTANNVIKKISNEILSGNIGINPIYNKRTKIDSCKFCEYKSICKFDTKTNKYSYIENKSKEEILEEIKNQKGD